MHPGKNRDLCYFQPLNLGDTNNFFKHDNAQNDTNQRTLGKSQRCDDDNDPSYNERESVKKMKI